MQGWIIRYVEDLKARIEPTGCSIQQAIERELAQYSRVKLLKLREAALDLQRIVDVEIGKHDDRAQEARDEYDRYRFGGPNYDHDSTPDGV